MNCELTKKKRANVQGNKKRQQKDNQTVTKSQFTH